MDPQPKDGRYESDLYGVLCLALGELCWLGGPEEGAQIKARQLRHVSQLLCGPSRQPWGQVGENFQKIIQIIFTRTDT